MKKLLMVFVVLCGVTQITNAQDTLAKYILTPKEKPTPQINGAKIFGVRPGHPVLYTVATTGNRPMVFSAKNLPAGVKLNSKTGQLSGVVNKAGTYLINLTAKNSLGTDNCDMTLVVGEDIALTPPMGWNSWNIYASKLTQKLVLANAKAMVSSGLINHGWTYINIDDVWQGRRGGDFNGILPDSTTFPNMQALVDAIHQMGLKAGVYSSPWIETYGRHIGGSADNPQGIFTKTPDNIPRNKKQKPFAIGQYMFVDNDVRQFDKWGFDYLKYDWNPNELSETKLMFDGLRNGNRDVVYSLSNSTPFGSIGDLSKVSNAWRTGGDIRDTWKSLQPRLFSQDKWAPFESPGHWNDPDMMVLGWVGWGKDPYPTHLTPDEQYTHMSAWCLMSVPLLLGNDLTKLDTFTLSLLTNDEVIAVNQDPLGKQATVISKQGDAGILAKDMADGSKAAGLFNPGDTGAKSVVLNWKDLGITGKYIVRDLWRQKDLGVFENEFKADVAQHGVVMVSLRKAK
jgi:alpha-galactosidase